MSPAPSSESHSGSNSEGSFETQFLDRGFPDGPENLNGIDRKVDCSREKLPLGPEVVMYQRGVHARVGGYRPYRCSVNPVASK